MSEPTSAQATAANATAADSKKKTPEAAAPAAADAKTSGDEKAEGDTSADSSKADKSGDVEMKDTTAEDAAPAEDDSKEAGDAAKESKADGDAAAAAPATPAADKNKSRRKSTGASASKKGGNLKKKASRTRLTHLDAKPGDYFFVRLKGYPLWPAIICDESMLPNTLLKTRPVTAMRQDGTYREDYADGGKRAHDRTYPVMYLCTNEFGWIPNTDLEELDTSTVGSIVIKDSRKKDLQEAHLIAAENHDLQYFKDVLLQHQEELTEQLEADKAAAAAQEATKAAAAAKKSASKEKDAADEDVDMADAGEEDGEPVKEKKPSKKRKAEDEIATPQRSDSVKKPKIKLTNNSTPKAPANGATPKSSAKPAAEAKSAKSKSKKVTVKDAEDKKPADKAEKKEEAPAPKEPEMTAEEKHSRKEKEVLFLRHKLQKGLLTRDQVPKEDEMKNMSDFVTKLEGMPELEVSIIRATKINKVLKGILKLENIPKEDEFKFKPRSQALLDKWNKLLAFDGPAAAPAAAADAPANGVNGDAKKATANGTKEEKKDSKAADSANGVKENGDSKAEEPKEAEKEKAGGSGPEAAKTEEVAA